MRSGLAALTLAALVAAAPMLARADEVTDQIAEAEAAYQKKDIVTAIAALDAAASLLRQSRADAWKALLPAAPAGWTAEEAQSSAAGASLFGGGTGVTRKYLKGDENVEISILAESPLVQAMSAVIGNPMVAAMAGRVVVIGGRRLTFMSSDNAFVTLVADKVLVRVQGSSGLNEAALRPFVTALDFAAIEKLVR